MRGSSCSSPQPIQIGEELDTRVGRGYASDAACSCSCAHAACGVQVDGVTIAIVVGICRVMKSKIENRVGELSTRQQYRHRHHTGTGAGTGAGTGTCNTYSLDPPLGELEIGGGSDLFADFE